MDILELLELLENIKMWLPKKGKEYICFISDKTTGEEADYIEKYWYI